MNTMTKKIRNLMLLAALGAGIAAGGAPGEASAQRGARGNAPAVEQTESGQGVVNIQTATPEQLQLLPGIGPAKAQAIVAYREQRAFRTVEDIMRVRGIGRATFRNLRPMLTVQGPTTLTERVPARRPPAPEAQQSE
jgi:competence protein ComEA